MEERSPELIRRGTLDSFVNKLHVLIDQLFGPMTTIKGQQTHGGTVIVAENVEAAARKHKSKWR